MPLLSYSGFYSPELCNRHPDTIFLFGDNLVGYGKGGQAIIRDCNNAFGIPTKALPTMSEEAFFDDSDTMARSIIRNLLKATFVLSRRLDVVVPVTADGAVSLGLGLADLPRRAPGLYLVISRTLAPEGVFGA